MTYLFRNRAIKRASEASTGDFSESTFEGRPFSVVFISRFDVSLNDVPLNEHVEVFVRTKKLSLILLFFLPYLYGQKTAYGFGGASFVVSVLTDNNNRATADVKSVVGKRNGKMAESGSVYVLAVYKC